ncbi:unnamed protein product [Enterobius vermicularis]|uniref:Cytochrome P450 n=1 Tax=Enterobius vermicularis TaxID=51028 RepID=A0A0N4V271_ENTVE|nr:unnamed protein product [Enterobius vermicularis]
MYWKRRNLPPGPIPLLAAGNIPYLLFYNSIDEMFLSWKQRYGPLITFWIGPIPLVMVTEVDVMKKYFILHSDIFSNRWRNFITDTFMGGANGVVQIDGPKWQEQRRFSLHVLRDFGVGRSLMEEKIELEVQCFIDYLQQKCNTEIDICQMTAVCVGNIIHNILFGKRFPQGSKEFHFLHSVLDKQSRLVVNPIMGLYIASPWFSKIPLINGKYHELLELRKILWTYLRKQVEEHRQNYSSQMELTDFTYTYMREMEERKERDEQGYFKYTFLNVYVILIEVFRNVVESFSEWQLTMLLLDLFFAGMETTVTTMKWGFLMSLIHQDVQAKIQEELDRCGERIRLSDQTRCPFTVATIKEIQRIANILPINLLRTAAEDINIDGYYYPKGTLCIPQISVVMNDPQFFKDPTTFCPDRFLEADMKTPKRYFQFIFIIEFRLNFSKSL